MFGKLSLFLENILFYVLTWRSFAKHNTINITSSQVSVLVGSYHSVTQKKGMMFFRNLNFLVIWFTFICGDGMFFGD